MRTGTYRVQLHPDFAFAQAAERATYWAKLGLSHVYTSPYLQAAKGSLHGYDVVDPTAVNHELGGVEGRERFCSALNASGLKQLIDVVPNHMAIRGGHNAWWWDVLENGPSSRYSNYFDVEWRASDAERILLPVLGDQYGVELDAGRITLERSGGQLYVRYFDQRNPLAPRSLGWFLRPVAAQAGDPELAFVADALSELPAPNAPDAESRRRRDRDKRILQATLEELLQREDIASAVDLHVSRTNSSTDGLHELLEMQNYRLAFWKYGNQELDYRRFFDIDSLIGLRVEDEEVFDATHELILSWVSDGSVDGLRLDHIDGLYNPHQYLERLRRRAPNAWLLVEKILEGDEQLPAWPVSGTTGYEFLNLAQRILTDPQGEQPLSEFYDRCTGEPQHYEAIVEECKHLILHEVLASDLKRLVNRLLEICHTHRRFRDYTRGDLEALLVEVCVAFPVYRTYGQRDEGLVEGEQELIRNVCQKVRESNPDRDGRLVDFLERLLLLEWRGDSEVEFVMRFQQLTGPAMAKSVEDTAFYRFARFVPLNEVGGNPVEFSIATAEFHEAMARRQACYPEALNTTSTHDTKRSEDVRARLLVLSEAPELWTSAVSNWAGRVAQILKGGPSDTDAALGATELDASTEYMLWQNLIGAWPIEIERMQAYMTKAVREAKLNSSWHAPNAAYEETISNYLQAIYSDEVLLSGVEDFVLSILEEARKNSLCQVLLKTTCPGVPDVYQGTELWDLSLVDPDNRRQVDYEHRARVLDEVSGQTTEQLWASAESGAVKLSLLAQALKLRAARPACFDGQGKYQPLFAEGTQAERVLAYGRGSDVVAVITRWHKRLGSSFEDTQLPLPPGTWTNTLTGASLSGCVELKLLLGSLPVALLERQGAFA